MLGLAAPCWPEWHRHASPQRVQVCHAGAWVGEAGRCQPSGWAGMGGGLCVRFTPVWAAASAHACTSARPHLCPAACAALLPRRAAWCWRCAQRAERAQRHQERQRHAPAPQHRHTACVLPHGMPPATVVVQRAGGADCQITLQVARLGGGWPGPASAAAAPAHDAPLHTMRPRGAMVRSLLGLLQARAPHCVLPHTPLARVQQPAAAPALTSSCCLHGRALSCARCFPQSRRARDGGRTIWRLGAPQSMAKRSHVEKSAVQRQQPASGGGGAHQKQASNA